MLKTKTFLQWTWPSGCTQFRNVMSCKLAFSDTCCYDCVYIRQWSELRGQCSENSHHRGTYYFIFYIVKNHFTTLTSLVVWWSEFLTTDHEIPGSIPGSNMGFFLEGEDYHGDHGLGSLVELRFKAPSGTSYSCITIRTTGVPNSEVRYTFGNHEVHKVALANK
jgi:hypothetical protein